MEQKEIVAKLLEKGILISPENLEKAEELLKDNSASVKVVQEYIEDSKKRPYEHFVRHLNNKFKALEAMLKSRPDLQDVTSIGHLRNKNDRDYVCVMGMILEKDETRNNNIIIKLEDRTGVTSVLFSNKNGALHELANDLSLDEVIAVKGSKGNNIVFANELFHPDVPLNKELKKGPDEEYVCFVGDTHFGSETYLTEEFDRMTKWLKGEIGNEQQKRMGKLTKYIIITGDIVEGVGVYPGQENHLQMKDVKEQYEGSAKEIAKIPKDREIIIIPGNHDTVRLAEPQPKFYKDFAESIYKLPNVTLVSNPSIVNIGSKEDFSGFDILLYHGFSLPYYAMNVPSIRAAGGMKRTDLILKYLMQRRHLSPSYGASQFVPCIDADPLIISKVPDFFVTGHIHRLSVSNYRNVTLINAGCWNAVTEDQEKRGIEPQPAKLPIINLQTRQVHLMNFLKADKKETGMKLKKEVEK